jgi:rubrerythrin
MNTEQDQTLAALKIAIQMEIDGKKYYVGLSKTGANESGRKLFAALAVEEDVHLRNFEQIYRAIEAKEGWPAIKVIPGHTGVLETILSKAPVGNLGDTASEIKSVQKAMAMENKTLDYYLEQAGKSVYPLKKEFFEAVAGQERIHHSLLLDYFEYLKDPAQYFTMKERHSLDGG